METTAGRVRDAWIALRCQAGEPGAFEALVREMERPLLYYLRRLMKQPEDAFDVLQETWLAAFRSIRRLDDAASLRPWLYRIAHGIAVTRVRREVAREEVEEGRPAPGAGAPEEPVFSKEEAAAIHRALDGIGPAHREVLVLHFLEELELEEIASIVGCPLGTVKSRIHHAKWALKEALTGGRHGT